MVNTKNWLKSIAVISGLSIRLPTKTSLTISTDLQLHKNKKKVKQKQDIQFSF